MAGQRLEKEKVYIRLNTILVIALIIESIIAVLV